MTPDQLAPFLAYLPPEMRALPWRAHPLDGKLLLFERDTGLNVLLEGEETAQFRRIAPRALLIAVTNACDLACPFCYRDLDARSEWDYASLLDFCQQADQWGVMEVAFGGGEPLLFPRWAEFIAELYATTRLSVNFTTNGTRLTADFLREIAGKYGQIRLSLYDTNNWRATLQLLAESGARFGVNWMITPPVVADFESQLAELIARGVRGILLISYKGSDRALHLDAADRARLSAHLNAAYERLGDQVQFKLDTCWDLPDVPRLFTSDDCGASDAILSITSDKRVKPCSFHHLGKPFASVDDLRLYWEEQRAARIPALIAGCTRV